MILALLCLLPPSLILAAFVADCFSRRRELDRIDLNNPPPDDR